jgi:tRNA(Ile)-lysidine synthase
MTIRSDDLSLLVRHALPPGGRAMLAVSGGLDSMVLLDVAAAVQGGVGGRDGSDVVVATFDHATGAHSAMASGLVVRRALEYGLPVVTGRADDGLRSEAEWRAARWSFLEGAAHASGSVILTAHTRDDQVETVIMRGLRDAGARGLAGLYAASEVRRPFVDVSRAELHAYAAARRLQWIEDPTNASRRYLRNRVRLDLLPALRRVRPSIDAELLTVARDAATWRQELTALIDAAIDVHVVSAGDGRAIDVATKSLAGYSREVLEIVWPELASRAGVTLDRRGTRRAAEFTITGRAGGRIQLSGGWELIRARSRFELRRSQGAPRARIEGADGQRLTGALTWDRWSFAVAEPAGRADDRDPWRAHLPGDEPLFVRAWRPGDRLISRQGKHLTARKVKHFLSDAGVSGHIRPRWPVVLAGAEVVWIPGVRRSDAATERSGRPVVTYVCDYLDRRS